MTVHDLVIPVFSLIMAVAIHLIRKLKLSKFEPTVGTITKSEVTTFQRGHRFGYIANIEFKYSAEGRELSGGQYSLDYAFFGDKERAEELCKKYPVNSSHPALYNRGKHSEAIIHIPPNYIALFFLFASVVSLLWIFATKYESFPTYYGGIIGLGMILGPAFLLYKQLWVRFGSFVLGQGTITKSEVVRHGRTYSASITFDYIANGAKHSGGMYNISQVRFGSPELAKRICAELPVGSTQQIWYHQSNPRIAVINRSVSIAPCIMILIGVGILLVL